MRTRAPEQRNLTLVASFLLAGAMLQGCGIDAAREKQLQRDRLRRVHDQFGLDSPIQVFGGARIDDGGTASVSAIGAGPETLMIYADNRGFVAPQWSTEPFVIPMRHVWLGGYPETPGARELAFGSSAESAVVDLIRLGVRQRFTAQQETSLVRAERQSWHPKHGDPGYHWMVWSSALTPTEREVLGLRGVAAQIEMRRAHPVDTLNAAPAAPATTRPAPP